MKALTSAAIHAISSGAFWSRFMVNIGFKTPELTSWGATLLTLASLCLVLMYKVAICHLVLSALLLAVLYSLLVVVGRPCRCLRRPPSLSPLTLVVTTAGPLAGPARPPCNYPFPIPTGSQTLIGLGGSALRFGGSGPCIVKVEQQLHFAFLDYM
jgi:hypothetical protein